MPFSVVYGRYLELETQGLSPNLAEAGFKSHALQIGDDVDDCRKNAQVLLTAARQIYAAASGPYTASQNRRLEGFYILCDMLTYVDKAQQQDPRILFLTPQGGAYQHYESNMLNAHTQADHKKILAMFDRMKAASPVTTPA